MSLAASPRFWTRRARGAPTISSRSRASVPSSKELLNEIGIYHLDQIAGWSAEEVAWADENLVGFKGRVSRDDWVGQAQRLVSGG